MNPRVSTSPPGRTGRSFESPTKAGRKRLRRPLPGRRVISPLAYERGGQGVADVRRGPDTHREGDDPIPVDGVHAGALTVEGVSGHLGQDSASFMNGAGP